MTGQALWYIPHSSPFDKLRVSGIGKLESKGRNRETESKGKHVYSYFHKQVLGHFSKEVSNVW